MTELFALNKLQVKSLNVISQLTSETPTFKQTFNPLQAQRELETAAKYLGH